MVSETIWILFCRSTRDVGTDGPSAAARAWRKEILASIKRRCRREWAMTRAAPPVHLFEGKPRLIKGAA